MTTDQRRPRFLTPAEDAMIRAHYPNTSTSELAALMGITTDQVSNYAKSRKLRKSDKYLEDQKQKTVARLTIDKRAAEQRRLSLSDEQRIIAMRIQATPAGAARRTGHGTAYQSGHITTHVMR